MKRYWQKLAKRAAKQAAKAIKRFLVNKPKNSYEGILFTAARTVATQFGQGRTAIP